MKARPSLRWCCPRCPMTMDFQEDVDFGHTPAIAVIQPPPQSLVEVDDVAVMEVDEVAEVIPSFNVSLPIAEVVAVQEVSLLEEPIPTVLLDDGPVNYRLVEGGSRKGGNLVVDSSGFTYFKRRETIRNTTWLCSLNRSKVHPCYANLAQPIGTEIFNRGPHSHTHPGDPATAVRATTRAEVKEEATLNPFAFSGKIVKDVLRKLDTDLPLPKYNSLLRCANRARQGLRPDHPKDLLFEMNNDFIPEDFKKTDIEEHGQRHLIFATETQLSHLNSAKAWYIDGTLKVVREPFVQLLSIHCFIKQKDEL